MYTYTTNAPQSTIFIELPYLSNLRLGIHVGCMALSSRHDLPSYTLKGEVIFTLWFNMYLNYSGAGSQATT